MSEGLESLGADPLSIILENLSDKDLAQLAMTSTALHQKINEWDAKWERQCMLHFPLSCIMHDKNISNLKVKNRIFHFHLHKQLFKEAYSGMDENHAKLFGLIRYNSSNEVEDFLNELGGDLLALTSCNKEGETVLKYATRLNKMGVVRILLRRMGGYTESYDGFWSLAITYPNLIPILLEFGADINYKFKDGTDLLVRAIEENQIQAVKYLVESGLDPNIKRSFTDYKDRYVDVLDTYKKIASNYQDVNALHIAVLSGNDSEIINILLEKGKVDVNEKDSWGYTALHFAVFGECSTKTIDVLLSNGANIEARNSLGLTPLFEAVKHNDLIGVKTLIAHGADVTAKDKHGRTVLHYIARRGYSNKILEMIDSLIKAGANINEPDNEGATPLHNAYIGLLPEELSRSLIRRGADKYKKDNEGTIPLFYPLQQEGYCFSGYRKEFFNVIARGEKFDWDDPDNQKYKPIFDACMCMYNYESFLTKLFNDTNLDNINHVELCNLRENIELKLKVEKVRIFDDGEIDINDIMLKLNEFIINISNPLYFRSEQPTAAQAFIKGLIGVLLTIAGLFIPLAFPGFRTYFFESPTVHELSKVSRALQKYHFTCEDLREDNVEKNFSSEAIAMGSP